jgi:hypothetical protein
LSLRAVFFDVGETLVDEERWWRELTERAGLQPHVVWAALGVTNERGEEQDALWGHLGIGRPTGGGTVSRTRSTTCIRTRSTVSKECGRSTFSSGSSAIRRRLSSGGRETRCFPQT